MNKNYSLAHVSCEDCEINLCTNSLGRRKKRLWARKGEEEVSQKAQRVNDVKVEENEDGADGEGGREWGRERGPASGGYRAGT